MRLPIDTQTVNFVSAGPPEPVIDFETKQQRVDPTGQPLFNVHLPSAAGAVTRSGSGSSASPRASATTRPSG